ncbi:phosphonate metabolism transcriptional regulator PhnF [Pseudochrobactrum sp. Wa41.01b-1]|uniref:phosphonate metabolism transcriptional regulator PhnF n=1 Tax=Pseudochrobactrum sp. Wa41.01b-1 TaxID=2864102 RepID=UPI001C68D8F8|nr:phosphonate metabolism transcriptional regulator PhnF [Pseudochrobactrum sp. Wa41.01b-1]QYM72225.1 phosphonate metabolism transcriptional regulator PhnF [Pseudochrobactrum sp. Wa41.01b-1]
MAETTKIARNSGVAVWRQIADEIRREIKHGHFKRGEKLPPEMTLAARFGVNRHTVRSAIAALTQEGVLRAEQGRGTFIANAKRLTYPISKRTRMSTSLAEQITQQERIILSHRIEKPSAEVAHALQLSDENAQVHYFETLSIADGQPVSMSDSWFDQQRFPQFDEFYKASGSVTKALKQSGIEDYFRKSTLISAQHANGQDLLHLKLTPGAIVLTAQSVNVDTNGVPVEYSATRFAADRMEFSIESMSLNEE